MNNWSDIKNKIEDILEFDFANVFEKKGKENAVFQHKDKLKKVLQDIRLILDFNDNDLENLFFENNAKQNLFQYLHRIFGYFETIKNGDLSEGIITRIFSDFSYIEDKILSKIKFHNFEKNKTSILTLIRGESKRQLSDLKSEIRKIRESVKLQEKNRELADELEKKIGNIKVKESILNKANVIAEQLISNSDTLDKVEIEKYRKEFLDKANKHLIWSTSHFDVGEDVNFWKNWWRNKWKVRKLQPPFFWLITSVFFAFFTYVNIEDISEYVKKFLTIKDDVKFEYLKDVPFIIYITIFSKIFIPAVISIFSINQFLGHKRIHENYINKDIVLKNMLFLVNEKRNLDNGLITKEALNILFSEVSLKENNNKDLVSMAKSVIKK